MFSVSDLFPPPRQKIKHESNFPGPDFKVVEMTCENSMLGSFHDKLWKVNTFFKINDISNKSNE